MKKIAMIMTMMAAVGTTWSCKKVKSLANIGADLPYPQTVTIPAYSEDGFPVPEGGTSLPFPAIPVATNSREYIAQYNTSADKVVSVSLKSLNMHMTKPEGENFDFVDTIQLYISAPPMPEVLMAYDYTIAKGTNDVSLTTTNVNLKEYFLKDTMYIRPYMHITKAPKATEIDIKSIFRLVANPLN